MWCSRLMALAMCFFGSMGQAVAWESEDAVPLPRPAIGARPEQVWLDKATLSIKGQNLVQRYEWLNKGAAVDADLAIYLPPFDWQGAAADYGDRHFPELTVRQDGQLLKLHRATLAWHGGRDITALLRQGAIDPLLVAENEVLSAPLSPRGKSVWRELVRKGAAHELDGMYMPDWFVQSLPSWHMHWPAGRSSTLQLSHKARPAFSPWETGGAALDALLRSHCSSLTRLRADFDAHQWPWPENIVVQRFDVPLGVHSWHVDHVDLDFDPGAEWSGLVPRMAYLCGAEGALISGQPAITRSTINVRDDRLSILLILPQ